MPEPTLPEPTFDEIMKRLADPNTMTAGRLELARTISQRMTQDPDFLAAVERVFADHGTDISTVAPGYAELAARETNEPGGPSPAQAAAAALGAAAILAGPYGPPASPGQ